MPTGGIYAGLSNAAADVVIEAVTTAGPREEPQVRTAIRVAAPEGFEPSLPPAERVPRMRWPETMGGVCAGQAAG